MNTKIEYLYRDADNYKIFNSCVVAGEITEEQKEKICSCLDDGEYFIPDKVGLPEDKYEGTEADHPWFEFIDAEVIDMKPTISMTIEKLVKNFEEMKDGWEK